MSRRYPAGNAGLVLALALGSPLSSSAAQGKMDPATVVPDDALIYVGWSGRDLPFGETQPGVGGFPFWEAINAIAQSDGPHETAAAFWRSATTVFTILWESPAALTVLDIGSVDAEPYVRVGLVVNAGERSAELQTAFTALMQDLGQVRLGDARVEGVALSTMIRPRWPALYWGTHRGYFLLTVDTEPAGPLIRSIDAGGPGLAGTAELQTCRRAATETDERPIFSVFVDVVGLVSKCKAIARDRRGEPLTPETEAALEKTGINGVRSVYFQLGLVESANRFSAYIHAPQPRKGVLRLWEQKPLDEADFAFVPADAHYMHACNWDLAATGQYLDEALSAVVPTLSSNLRAAYSEAAKRLGVSASTDLIQHLGDTWVVYDAPSHGGFLITGAVIVAELRDGQRFMAGMQKLTEGIADLLSDTCRVRLRPVTCAGRKMTQVTVTGVPFPLAPSWGEIAGHWVFGLFPQSVALAMDQIDPTTRRSSLLNNPEFSHLRKRLPPDAQTVSYVNNRHFARLWYPVGLAVGHIQRHVLRMSGIDLDPTSQPTLMELLAQTRNGAGVTAADDEGILYVSLSPGVSPVAYVGAMAAVVSVSLPSLLRARALAKRVVSAQNLRGIAMGGVLYAEEHNGNWPPDLESLVTDGYLTDRKLFVSPLDEPGSVSYVYVAGQSEADDPGNVVVYEKPELNDYEGTNVLFLDAHVEFMRMEAFKKALRETYERLGRESEMPTFAE